MPRPKKDDNSIPLRVLQRIQQGPTTAVWTPRDFYDLSNNRNTIMQALHRMAKSQLIRRIDRGLYDLPHLNSLTGKLTVPDYRRVIDAISRRDQMRILIDGLTAANDLGLTNAVPAQVIVHCDARIKVIRLDQLVIHFKLTSPSKLYWAGHPAMRIVQALHWFGDMLKRRTLMEEDQFKRKIIQILKEPKHGPMILEDLIQGLYTLPFWMQDWIQNLLAEIK
jgi:hypothetical protein